MIEMAVESVRYNPETQQRVVILQTLQQDRYLFIQIAHPEAYAIAYHLQEGKPPFRPLSHDLMKNIVDVTGSKVLRVVISDLVEDTNEETKPYTNSQIFFAQIVMDVAGKEVEVDARPSDAIALAIRANAPMFVAERVLDEARTSFPAPTEKETGLSEKDSITEKPETE